MILYRIVFIVAVIVLGGGAPVSAFSLGPISVNSKFGEPFDAEIELKTEMSGPVEVSVGSEEDYKKLQLKRRDIVDEVMVVPPLERQGDKLVVHLSSKKSLFYPSFNLVIKASQSQGTLLENYLIRVDFKQSLALKVKDESKAEPKKKEKTQLSTPSRVASAEKAPTAPLQKTPQPTQAPVSPEVIQETTIEPPKAPPLIASTPLVGQSRERPEKVARVRPRRVPVRVEAEPKNSKQAPPPGPTSEASPPPESEIFVFGDRVRTLKKGESLLTIARSINADSQQAFRIAVAIWQENKEKFIYGNMHGIHAGSELNLEDLEERLADLDMKRAREILWSQWEEWKVIQKIPVDPGEQETLSGDTEDALPEESARDYPGIFKLLTAWKKSWEEEDLARHLSLFAPPDERRKGILPNHLRAFKSKMFRTHDRVRLGASHAFIFHKMGETWVSFNQTFFSDRIESVGRKDIGLVHEDGEWKILLEKFFVRDFLEKTGDAPSTRPSPVGKGAEGPVAAPYVIHVSSHLDRPTATQVVNQLRRRGLSAYSSPTPVGDVRNIYRVYVGRFFSRDVAQAVTRQIRVLSIGRFSLPVSAPYALEVGDYTDEKQALEQIKSLRAQKLSPFLFVTSDKDFSPPRFQVLVGAFDQVERTSRLSDQFSKLALPFNPVQP